MRDRSAQLFMGDILASMEKIELYIRGMSFDDFRGDQKTVDAVLRNLEVIGEAARNVPQEMREKHPGIPWRRMIGLRNIVSHEYFGVDVSIIWRIITVNLPEARPLIEAAMSAGENGST